MITKVYILVREPYHDTCAVLGAFSSVEAAMLVEPDEKWSQEGWYVDNRPNVAAQSEKKHGEMYLVYKFEVQSCPVMNDPKPDP